MIDLHWHKGHWIQSGALEVRGNQLHSTLSSWNSCREASEVKSKTHNATVSETENGPLWWFFCLGAQLQPLWIGLVLLALQFYSPGLSLSAPPPFSAVQSVQQSLIHDLYDRMMGLLYCRTCLCAYSWKAHLCCFMRQYSGYSILSQKLFAVVIPEAFGPEVFWAETGVGSWNKVFHAQALHPFGRKLRFTEWEPEKHKKTIMTQIIYH